MKADEIAEPADAHDQLEAQATAEEWEDVLGGG